MKKRIIQLGVSIVFALWYVMPYRAIGWAIWHDRTIQGD